MAVAATTPTHSALVVKWRLLIILTISITITVLVLFASSIRLFNVYFHFEDYVNDQLRTHLDGQVPKKFDTKDIALILVDADEKQEQPFGRAQPDHRKFHAQLIDGLAAAGARVVALDVFFDSDSDYDKDLAQSVIRAENMGTHVLIGMNPEVASNDYVPAELKSIPSETWGSIAGGGDPGRIVVLPLLRLADKASDAETIEQPVTPSLVLKAVTAVKYPHTNVTCFFDSLHEQINIRDSQGRMLESIPVDGQLYFMVNLAGPHDQGRVHLYHEVLRAISQNNSDYLKQFRGKIVVVGYRVGDVVKTTRGDRYGGEVIANAMSNVLLQSYVQPLGFVPHFSLVLFMVGLGAILPLKFNKWTVHKLPVKLPLVQQLPVPIVLLAVSVVYVFIAVIFYLFGQLLFGVAYHVAALFLAYLSTSILRTKLGFV
jgi:CHASE2 domain-containing sensor protein